MPLDDLASLEPLEGGHSGETFLGRVGGDRVVVRVYARPSDRGEAAAEVDAALLRLVRGLVPVADVLELRRADRATGMPALLVTSYVEGRRGDLLLPGLDDAGLTRLGATLGGLLAVLGTMPQLSAGPFVDATLAVGRFGGDDGHGDDHGDGHRDDHGDGHRDGNGLPGFVEAREPALGHLAPDELAGLRAVALDAQALLDTVGRRVLVHGDLNPKNLLVDPETLAVSALVDWEYAHAGHPATDLGNLLRFDRRPAFQDAVLAAYAERHPADPSHLLALARAADLVALVDLATRRGSSPVADRADRLLRAVAATRDPGTPEPSPY